MRIKIGSGRSGGGGLPSWQHLLGSKGKITGIIVTVLVVGLLLLDFLVLRGDVVARGSVEMSDQEDFMVIPVAQQFEEHYVTIDPGSSRRDYRLSYRLVDPEGDEVVSDSELLSSSKTRGFTFEPLLEGEYRLFVDNEQLIGHTTRSARVRVYVNDRRFISKVFD
jgi:hypothetical protein